MPTSPSDSYPDPLTTVRRGGSEELLRTLEAENAVLREELRLLKADHLRVAFQALMDAFEGSCYALDADFRYLCFNEKHRADMVREFGAHPALGASMHDLLAGRAEWERMEAQFRRTLAGESPTAHRFVDRGAERRIFEIRQQPVFCADGEIIGLAVVSRETVASAEAETSVTEGRDHAAQGATGDGATKHDIIHELRRSREELQRLNHMKDRFFSIIAHDLRSPFNGFLNISKALKEDLDSLTLEDVQDCAGILYASALGFYELLENLLVWASVQGGKIECQLSALDLSSVILRNLDLCRPIAHKKRIHLEENCPADVSVMADAAMLDTIFRNLLNNALKFTHAGGRVSVDARLCGQPPARKVRIEVKDTGIGIPSDLLSALFSPDGRTGRTGTAGEVSSGLGLILTSEFVRLHGGQLDVRSKVGEGTIFGFALPLS